MSSDEDEEYDEESEVNPLAVHDAVKDLMMLEQVHVEADRMKGLGNKHMAEKDYQKALKCYSAALRLSPVGPNSHVFLSNRAASLLSLKHFEEAVDDAKSAISLQPTFGKAHARLGQALYYLKDYVGSVEAYENAVHYDPDNAVSCTYLNKARAKLEKRQKRASGTDFEDAQTVGSYQGSQGTYSVLSHWYPQGHEESHEKEDNKSAVVREDHYNGVGVPQEVPAVTDSTGSNQLRNSNPAISLKTFDIEDQVPNEEEAERLYRKGNKRIARKEFQSAIEEFSAAIWLCPDDSHFSPKYYLGRAAAYLHVNEYMLAKEDCEKSLHLFPDDGKGYMLLGKALFELHAYHECIDVMEYGFELLEEAGLTKSKFDEVYLTKAKTALINGDNPQSQNSPQHAMTSSSSRRSIPKLPPPRFVSREEAIQTTTNVPALPSSWPVQSVGETRLKVGPERLVIFGEGPMGVKLNRGSDGVVRVLSTTQTNYQIILEGEIHVGDVVREMANVDLRRPLTNIMWGDTVALIKMAPRPISLVVARELSVVPVGALDQIARAAAEDLEQSVANEPDSYKPRMSSSESSIGGGAYQRRLAERNARRSGEGDYYPVPPSRNSGEEPVPSHVDNVNESEADEMEKRDSPYPDTVDICLDISAAVNVHEADQHYSSDADIPDPVNSLVLETEYVEEEQGDSFPDNGDDRGAVALEDYETEKSSATDNIVTAKEQIIPDQSKQEVLKDDEGACTQSQRRICKEKESEDNEIDNAKKMLEIDEPSDSSEDGVLVEAPHVDTEHGLSNIKTQRLVEEIDSVGGMIIFGDDPKCSWTNQHWSSTVENRKLVFVGVVTRLVLHGLLQKETWVKRKLLIFSNPNVILLVRDANTNDLHLTPKDDSQLTYLIAESVIDPVTSKLRLSNVTTPTSLSSARIRKRGPLEMMLSKQVLQQREASFELISPFEICILSVPDSDNRSSSEVFLEIAALESVISKSLHAAYEGKEGFLRQENYLQVVLGTLHSHVIVGNEAELKRSLEATKGEGREMLDISDEDGMTALHYACSRRFVAAVSLLLAASADPSKTTRAGNKTPCHLSAEQLDDKSISMLLASNYNRPDPNALDDEGLTPMFLACVCGRSVGALRDPLALGRCLTALESWGGEFLTNENRNKLVHPIHIVASEWRAPELSVILAHCNLNVERGTLSLGARFDYPIHAAIMSLRKMLSVHNGFEEAALQRERSKDGAEWIESSEQNMMLVSIHGGSRDEPAFVRTLRALLERGFEPNERVEPGSPELEEISGFSPFRLLASVMFESTKNVILPQHILDVVAHAARILVKSGARLALSPSTPWIRPLKKERTQKHGHNFINCPPLSRELNAEDSSRIIALLGGENRLDSACAYWSSFKTVEMAEGPNGKSYEKNPGSISISSPNIIEIRGGSDEKSCAICWQEFGIISNRMKICRASMRYVCNECSTKRLVINKTEFRVSDGQYNALSIFAVKKEIQKRKDVEQRKIQVNQDRKHREAVKQKQRDGLFGKIKVKPDNSKKVESNRAQDANNNLGGMAVGLNQTRNQLHERGEKLRGLADKTESLRDQSLEFAKLAKQLEEKQKGGFFW